MCTWKKKRATKRRYDSTAEMYDARYCEEQEAKYAIAFESLSLNLNKIVLDVGCGSGLLFRHVACSAGAVVGVDISHGLLLQARRRAKTFGNVHLVQADADHLPFADALSDAVFAFTVLQNMPKPSVTLREINRVVKEEGFLVITALKKAISLESFGKFLNAANLSVLSLRDDDSIQCVVVVAVKGRK